MKMPSVSVVVTSFNHEKYIEEAIDSVLDQTFTDFRLIIWMTSTDKSWSLINQYADSASSRFAMRSEKAAWGLNRASRKWLQPIHRGIIPTCWEPANWRNRSFLDAHSEIGAVFTNALAITEAGSPLLDEHFYFDIFDPADRTRHEWLRVFQPGNACHPGVLIRKSCYEGADSIDSAWRRPAMSTCGFDSA
jgi:hypothetical protein